MIIYSERGVSCISIKPMRGMLHLISFNTIEVEQAILDSNWLDICFLDIRDVNSKCAPLWRRTWIKVYGVPLSAWGYENFYNIGSIFGRVLSVNYSNFDFASVLVYTDCLFLINC